MAIIPCRIAAEENEAIPQIGQIVLDGHIMHPRRYAVEEPCTSTVVSGRMK